MNLAHTTCFAEFIDTFSIVDGQVISKISLPNYRVTTDWTKSHILGAMTCFVSKSSTSYPTVDSTMTYRPTIYLFEHNSNFTHAALFNTRDDQPNLWPLRHYFAYTMLRQPFPQHVRSSMLDLEHWKKAEKITKIFEKCLLFDSSGFVAWNSTGRSMFREQVHYWINRDEPLQHAIPAFPCKTTNPEKAPVCMPDGGEYEAIETLQGYCKEVQQVYPLGCVISIVSDGHVFSDCQGTDDDIVTEYNHRLKAMVDVVNYRIPLSAGGIEFHDLKQLLMPDDARPLLQTLPELPAIAHPTETKRDTIDDQARALMMAMNSIPTEYFTTLIKNQPNHPITALYRGFSMFMYQDLAKHPSHAGATKSQLKKAGERVAFEMIQRNQAYSRVVETILPCHVRLSIHAHNNGGPKFAVKLVPLRPIDNFDDLAVTQENAMDESHKHLHVPTPWHNCVVDIYRNRGCTKPQTMLCKSQMVVEALRSGQWRGGYCRHHSRGGRWVLHGPDDMREISTTKDALSIGLEHFRLERDWDWEAQQ